METVKSLISLRLLRNVAAVLGAGCVAKVLLQELWSLAGGFRAYFLAPWGISRLNLKQYGQWAVVTGASEGIGRGYALELARQGLDVVIMSRSEEKLQKVASEIKEKYGREVRVIAIDFSAGQDIYPQIAEELEDLDIGILVNNVAQSYDNGPEYFLKVSKLRLRNVIEINCQAMVQMTHMLLPRMLEKKKGIIVNLSTIGANGPCALLSVYVSTKIFVNYFSDSLHLEYGSKGIIIQTVMPNLVATAMSNVRRVTSFRPSPETYARTAVATIGIQSTTCGYWHHALQCYVLQWLPRRLYNRLASWSMAEARRKIQARLQHPPSAGGARSITGTATTYT